MPRTASANLIAVATKPYTQIQNSAPGPPETIAVATPAMLPVPIDAANAVMNAWNGVRAPSAPDALPENAARHASANRRTCTKRRRMVRNNPAPSSTPTTQGMKSASAKDWIIQGSGLRAQGSRLKAQIFDFDWQPSTVMDAPLIQLARG